MTKIGEEEGKKDLCTIAEIQVIESSNGLFLS